MVLTRNDRRLVLWLTAFCVAMAYLESAVVVYLRALYYPNGFDFPLQPMPPAMAAIEVGREAATVVMLLGIAMVSAADRWQRFFVFCIAFGVWDIFYYAWLWVFLGWPPSLLAWDVLFLIPVPWLGPVLAPVLVSLALIVASCWLWREQRRGLTLAFPRGHWIVAIAGGCLVLLAFMIDFETALTAQLPSPFRWDLFASGMALALGALIHGVWRLKTPRSAPLRAHA
jgi:hypothetical protein